MYLGYVKTKTLASDGKLELHLDPRSGRKTGCVVLLTRADIDSLIQQLQEARPLAAEKTEAKRQWSKEIDSVFRNWGPGRGT